MKKRVLLSVLSLIFIVNFFATTYANEAINVIVNGQPVEFEGQSPALIDRRTLVPVRGVFEVLGFDVNWNTALQQITLTRGSDVVVIIVGNYAFTTNGVSHTLDVPAQIINGSTMLPIRGVLESVGYYVGWDGNNNAITIVQPQHDIRPIDGRQLAEDFLSQYLSIFSFSWVYSNEDTLVRWDNHHSFGFVDRYGNAITHAPFLLPYHMHRAVEFYLYDFNNDGIPEIVIWYAAPDTSWNIYVVYKFIDGEYRAIHQKNEGSPPIFFTDPLGRMVILHNSDFGGNYGYFLVTSHNNNVYVETIVEAIGPDENRVFLNHLTGERFDMSFWWEHHNAFDYDPSFSGSITLPGMPDMQLITVDRLTELEVEITNSIRQRLGV